MQCLPPACGEITSNVSFGVRKHGIVRADRWVKQRLEKVVRTPAAVERIDHGLQNRDRAVIGARIRPAFEVVRLVDMPRRIETGLVEM